MMRVSCVSRLRCRDVCLKLCRRASVPDAKPCLLLIGPEGDFTPEELDGLIEAGAQPVGLGQNRLRVETAALAMLTAVTLTPTPNC